MSEVPVWVKPLVIAGVLALLWVLEATRPMFGRRKGLLGHDAANLTWGLINAGASALGLAAMVVGTAVWAEAKGFGLMHAVDWSWWAEWAVVLVAFDLWMYGWHRLNHTVPVLWRFHAVHHADREMDASSALRFHVGEIALSSLARCAVVPLLGVTAMQLVVYELILQPIILFHHSNVRVPRGLDSVLRWLIVTPWVHWVHHSKIVRETNSNYGSVLSIWDRLFGTYVFREDPEKIEYGLEQWGEHESRDVRGMATMPFKRDAGAVPGETKEDA